MLTRRAFVLAPAAALAGCAHRRNSGYAGYAFVANEEGRAVAVVDLGTFTLARHVPVDGNPADVICPPKRASVYALTPGNGLIHEIGTADLTVRRKIQAGRSAVSMRLAPDGSAVWVLSRQPRALLRVAVDQPRPASAIALPLDPYDFDLAPDGKSAVVSFGTTGRFGLVNLERRVCHVFDLGKNLSLARYRFDGKQVLIAAADEPLLSVLDAQSGRVVVHLPLAVKARNLCFKSDGGQLFITGEGMDAVVVMYPYQTEVSETTLAGRTPGYMAECATEDGDYLFVTNPLSGEVTILDVDSRRVIAVVGVGSNPGFIAVTPDAQYALVLNRNSGDMAVIRVAAIAADRARSAPLFTMIPVGSRPVSAAVRHV